jgi:hypothetical protein
LAYWLLHTSCSAIASSLKPGDVVVGFRDEIRLFDPATGAFTPFSDSKHGSGPTIDSPNGITSAANGDLFVASWNSIVRVDHVTGNRSIVSRSDSTLDLLVGSGPNFAASGYGMLLSMDNWKSHACVQPRHGVGLPPNLSRRDVAST